MTREPAHEHLQVQDWLGRRSLLPAVRRSSPVVKSCGAAPGTPSNAGPVEASIADRGGRRGSPVVKSCWLTVILKRTSELRTQLSIGSTRSGRTRTRGRARSLVEATLCERDYVVSSGAQHTAAILGSQYVPAGNRHAVPARNSCRASRYAARKCRSICRARSCPSAVPAAKVGLSRLRAEGVTRENPSQEHARGTRANIRFVLRRSRFAAAGVVHSR